VTRAVTIQRYLAIEMGMSTIINVGLAGIVTTLVFGGADQIARWGSADWRSISSRRRSCRSSR